MSLKDQIAKNDAEEERIFALFLVSYGMGMNWIGQRPDCYYQRDRAYVRYYY